MRERNNYFKKVTSLKIAFFLNFEKLRNICSAKKKKQATFLYKESFFALLLFLKKNTLNLSILSADTPLHKNTILHA